MRIFNSLSLGFATLLVAICFFTRSANASTLSSDSIRVSTISGLVGANGITISSNVYFSPGRSLTLLGADGTLKTASSVTASAFFGDGSYLTGVNTDLLSTTQTFSGANNFTSSFTVQTGGRQIILSTSPTSANFSIDQNGIARFYPEIHNSSSTSIPESFTTNSLLGPCLNGSTLTITTAGGRVELVFTGVLYQNALSSAVAMAFLQDGEFTNNFSTTKGIVYSRMSAGSSEYSGAFHYLLDAPPAGTHSYCLTISAPTGGTTYMCNHEFNPNATSEVCAYRDLFYIQEIR